MHRERRLKEELKTYKIVLGILYHQARRDWLMCLTKLEVREALAKAHDSEGHFEPFITT